MQLEGEDARLTVGGGEHQMDNVRKSTLQTARFCTVSFPFESFESILYESKQIPERIKSCSISET